MVNPPPTPKTNAAEAAVQRRRLPDDRVHFTAAVKCNLVAKVDRLGGVRVKVDEHECVSATVTSSGGAVRVRANQRVRCLKTFFFFSHKKKYVDWHHTRNRTHQSASNKVWHNSHPSTPKNK